jgi:transposase-like protein
MEKLQVGSSGRYVDEEMARELLERVRWPDGPICPHCVVVGGHYRVNPRKGSKRPVRPGVWKCRDCRKQFTVTVGTVFQGSKIPLRQWMAVIHLMNASDNLLNSRQLHTRLGLTYKSASS